MQERFGTSKYRVFGSCSRWTGATSNVWGVKHALFPRGGQPHAPALNGPLGGATGTPPQGQQGIIHAVWAELVVVCFAVWEVGGWLCVFSGADTRLVLLRVLAVKAPKKAPET